MSLTSYNLSTIVTGVTGLLRVKSHTCNTFKALLHILPSHTVTPVTGIYARACVRKKINLNKLNQFYFFSRVNEITRNTRNTRNNHCFYYIFYFFICNKSRLCCNKIAFTRNTSLKNQQGW